MSQSAKLPSKFVASAPPIQLADGLSNENILLIDTFSCLPAIDQRGDALGYAVTTGKDGLLRLLAIDDRASLPAPLREQLLSHASIAPLRTLVSLRQIYFFAMEALEPVPDTPGFNDPLWLRGRLCGPFNLGDGGDDDIEPFVATGKLATTRGDVLAALQYDAPLALHTVGPQQSGRFYHLHLPGEETAPLAAGEGVVIVYPWPALAGGGTGNDQETEALLYTILKDLQDDLRRSAITGDFVATRLPRPGEPTARAAGPKVPERSGWFEQLLAAFVVREATPEPTARIEDLLALTKAALTAIGHGPSAELQIVRKSNRLTQARWTADEDFGIAPVPTVGNGAFVFDGDAIVLPEKIAVGGGNVNLRLSERALYAGGTADLIVEVQYRDDAGPGNISLCYRPAGSDSYATLPLAEMTGSGEWRTARITAPGALLTRSLWYDCDIDFYCVSRSAVRLRRIDVRMLPSSASRRTQVGMDWTLLTVKDGGQGWIRGIGSLPTPRTPGAPWTLPRWPELRVPFDLVITDTVAGNANGEAYLLLSDDGQDISIAAPGIINWPGLVSEMGPALKNAGRAGVLIPEQLPAGHYRCRIRLLAPNARQFVEFDGGMSIAIVEHGDYSQIHTPGARGNFEELAGRSLDREINEFQRDELLECSFSGWIVDEARKSPEGQVVLILKNDIAGTLPFDALSRRDRGDVATHLAEPAYLRSGFSGILRGDSLQPGLYKCLLRLVGPDWLTYSEFDTGKWLKIVATD